MDRYRIEYAEKGIPGILCKYVIGTEELLNVLLKLKYFDKLKSFDNVKVCRNWKKNLTNLSAFDIIISEGEGLTLSV